MDSAPDGHMLSRLFTSVRQVLRTVKLHYHIYDKQATGSKHRKKLF